MEPHDLSGVRNEYRKDALDRAHVHPDPIKQFGKWMNQAIECGVGEPTALTLATVSEEGKPSARIVLLKEFDSRGFTFYTNYLSRKGRELDSRPYAAMVFFWHELERQLRIEGRIEKIPTGESDAYFTSRPEESKISAIISPQSQVVPDRNYLLELRDKYIADIPGAHHRPEYWGGYRLVPESMEFWQGRPGRLHDRIRYTLLAGVWKIERLAP